MQSLNGTWKAATDSANIGRAERWFETVQPQAQDIPVPGVIQQVFPTHQGVAWYWQTFTPDQLPAAGEQALLRFGAVEYLAEVWLNGQPVGGHEGSEMPFELDVTLALREGSNLLAVRVLKPGNARIDGYVLQEIPHRNQYDHAQFQPGMSYNVAGLTGGVELALAPAIHVKDVFADPDGASGQVTVHVSVSNTTGNPAHDHLRLVLSPAAGGEVLHTLEQDVELPPGDTVLTLQMTIAHPHVWNLDDPYLYRLNAQLKGHAYAIRFGLRDLRVIGGFFHLNGRRIFLRSSHTGNHFPIGQIVPPTPDLMRRDLLMAKATGFNCVRFIAGAAWPKQLDFCDEIGLMVYEECYASWVLEDSPHLTERYERSYNEMIRRDRNHPSVTIWGMINEMFDGPAFRAAVSYLPRLRNLDPTRLVLLASGRWDGQPGIGSLSNPGSREWQPSWGIEAPDAPPVNAAFTWEPGGYIDRAGDAHVYPPYPLEKRFAQQIRTLGAGTKPVFLSEFGIGSLMNVVEEERGYDQFDTRADLPDRALIRGMAQRLTSDLKRFGLEALYPFPADLLRDSYRLHSFQRRLAFDLIRSNPQLVGYNLTGLLDHGISGEGLWSFWRHWKDGIVEALEDGWSPLRWCLFANPPYGYPNQTLELEAVLATEDVLRPGEYPVCFRIWGNGKVWWERRAKVTIPAPDTSGR
ncbi:MAG TPA: glycoside hydrolase family 2 TIM barrel-domain containing protein, partial [Anaerolineae bacterium]